MGGRGFSVRPLFYGTSFQFWSRRQTLSLLFRLVFTLSFLLKHRSGGQSNHSVKSAPFPHLSVYLSCRMKVCDFPVISWICELLWYRSSRLSSGETAKRRICLQRRCSSGVCGMSNTEERAGISSTLQIASLHYLRHPSPPPPLSPANYSLKKILSIRRWIDKR